MKPRALFIAGATGAVGHRVVAIATEQHLELVPHVRLGSAAKLEHPKRVTMPLGDRSLVPVLAECTTVVQLIGTMRKRFASGDTYETSDIGTTRDLVAAAKSAKTIDHFVLLSSVGAGSPTGAYLKAKAQAERIVIESGLPYTIFRPSAFEDREGVFMPGMRAITSLLGLKKYQPIKLDELASAIVRVASQRAPLGAVLEGQTLWAQVQRV